MCLVNSENFKRLLNSFLSYIQLIRLKENAIRYATKHTCLIINVINNITHNLKINVRLDSLKVITKSKTDRTKRTDKRLKMKKKPSKNLFFDRLHKGVVIACIGLTLYGLIGFGERWYNYAYVFKPEMQRRQLLEKEKLLSEGASSS